MPGQRDRHAACVGEKLVADDAFDFLLFSLPDNDSYSHREGPAAQPTSIAGADAALARLMDAAGGPDEFLAEHAVIVMSDHSHDLVEAATNLSEVLSGWRVLEPVDLDPEAAELAVCPGSRSAQVYVLDEDAAGGHGRARGRGPGRRARGGRGGAAGGRARGGRHAAGRAALRPGRRRDRRPRPGLGPGGRPRGAGPGAGRGHAGLRGVPGRAPAAVVGGHLRAHRRPAAVGGAGVRVHRLGRRRPRGRGQPRLAARVRLARRPADLRRGLGTAPGRRPVVDRGRHADGAGPLRGGA